MLSLPYSKNERRAGKEGRVDNRVRIFFMVVDATGGLPHPVSAGFLKLLMGIKLLFSQQHTHNGGWRTPSLWQVILLLRHHVASCCTLAIFCASTSRRGMLFGAAHAIGAGHSVAAR